MTGIEIAILAAIMGGGAGLGFLQSKQAQKKSKIDKLLEKYYKRMLKYKPEDFRIGGRMNPGWPGTGRTMLPSFSFPGSIGDETAMKPWMGALQGALQGGGIGLGMMDLGMLGGAGGGAGGGMSSLLASLFGGGMGGGNAMDDYTNYGLSDGGFLRYARPMYR